MSGFVHVTRSTVLSPALCLLLGACTPVLKLQHLPVGSAGTDGSTSDAGKPTPSGPDQGTGGDANGTAGKGPRGGTGGAGKGPLAGAGSAGASGMRAPVAGTNAGTRADAAGHTAPMAGTMAAPPCPNAQAATSEVCDNKQDDDCDGKVDEDCTCAGGAGCSAMPSQSLAHPEVATITSALAAQGTCSAVLIRSHFMLTNLHCIDAAHGRDTSGGKVHFVTGKGASIDDVTWIEGRRLAWGMGFDPSHDLALLRLSRNIAMSELLPARLSARSIESGERVETVGWGCDAAADPANRRKAAASVAYPDNGACATDSGGGIFLTDGTLALLNVGVRAKYADVAARRSEIEAMMRALDDNFEYGIDRAGADYTSITVTTAAACKKRCTEEQRCRAFSFSQSLQRCWLKTGVTADYFNDDSTAGLPDNVMAGFDAPGNDLSSVETTDINRCGNECARTPDCAVYTINTGSGLCYLKSALGAYSSNPNCTTGLRRGPDDDIDRPGGELMSLAATSYANCQTACAEASECVAWVMKDGRCSLKRYLTDGVVTTGVKSQVRRGLEFFFDYQGNDIGSSKLSPFKPEACQAACRRNNACRAWTFGGLAEDGSGICFLKGEIPLRKPYDYEITGRSHTDLF